ncbi:MAG: phosphoribosyl-ATP diphosphatase [Candidatus Promineifilaceae bacterium]|nr:phosphoribosyl-ATP diphosphatase [Candidatus Promineifilaceae bacterium]
MSSTILHELFAVIESRRDAPHADSYTSQLLAAGDDRVLRKVGEEALEVILAAKGESDERLAEEMADLFYHALVLLVARGVTLNQVEAELQRRRQTR